MIVPELHKIKPKRVYVVDTSVVLHLILHKNYTDLLVKLFTLAEKKQLTLVAPNLLFYEVGNILARTSASQDQLSAYLQFFKSLDIGYMALDFFDMNKVAAHVATNQKLSFYDSAFYELAQKLKAPLLTTDATFQKNVSNAELVWLLKDVKV